MRWLPGHAAGEEAAPRLSLRHSPALHSRNHLAKLDAIEQEDTCQDRLAISTTAALPF